MDYYQQEAEPYFEATFALDSSFFLAPLMKRLPPGATVLDLGCGSGRDLRWLTEKGFRAIGFERSAALAALARTHTGCMVIEGDFQTYDFSKVAADAIMMSGSLVHTPYENIAAVLSRVQTVLNFSSAGKAAPNGILYLSLKEGRGVQKDPDGRIFYLWQDEAIRGIFSQLDYRVIDFTRTNSADGKGKRWLGYVLEV